MPTPETDIEKLVESLTANFAIPITGFRAKLANIKAFILDWDGVFNAGIKGDNNGSPFSEVDSMGLNMLRFSFYLKHGNIPAIFIITGENNQPALKLSQREHFNAVYLKIPDKIKALDHIAAQFNYQPDETAFVFDDILDLSVARKVSLRYFIKRTANPLLNSFIYREKLADYYTVNRGENNAVREVCEMSMALLGNYNEVVNHRIDYSSQYQEYLSERNNRETQYFTIETDRITEYPFP